MARTVTRSSLRDQIRERSEIRSVYVGDAAVNTMINQSIARLYDILAQADTDLYLSESTINVVSGTRKYAVPADFYKIRGLDYVVDASNPNIPDIALRRFNFAERNRIYAPVATSSVAPAHAYYTKYRRVGGNIWLTPMPDWANALTLYYIAAPATLDSDAATFDAIAGYEEWIVADCAIKLLSKEGADVSTFVRERQLVEQGIESQSNDSDVGEPDRVRNVDAERHYIGEDGWI